MTSIAAGSPASADEEKPGIAREPVPFSYIPSDIRKTMLAQQPLVAAANTVRTVIENGTSAGFTGMALEGNAVVVYWKGVPPTVVTHAITVARTGVRVDVRSAPYSLAELTAASEAVVKSMKANPNGPFHSVGTRTDGTGLTLEADGPVAAASVGPVAGVPVQVVQKQRRVLASRLADTSPFYGGGRITNQDNGAQCTSGFAVTAGGTNYILTAGHCGRVGGGWWNGNRSLTIGTASRENVGHDLLLIPGTVGGRIFDGGVGTGEFTKGVAGWQWVTPGEGLCLSPSFSGVICGATATSNFSQTDCGNDAYGRYECYSDLIVANNGTRACQSGDSGGPVFGLAPNSRVWAKGTITACGPGDFSFQDFGTANGDLGITTLTAS